MTIHHIFYFIQLCSFVLSAPTTSKLPTAFPTTNPTSNCPLTCPIDILYNYIGFGGTLEPLCNSAPTDNIFIGVRGILSQYTTASGLTQTGKKIFSTTTQYTNLGNIFGATKLKVSLTDSSGAYTYMNTDLGNGMSYTAYQKYCRPLMFLDEDTANFFTSITGQVIGVYDKNTNTISGSGSGILLNVKSIVQSDCCSIGKYTAQPTTSPITTPKYLRV